MLWKVKLFLLMQIIFIHSSFSFELVVEKYSFEKFFKYDLDKPTLEQQRRVEETSSKIKGKVNGKQILQMPSSMKDHKVGEKLRVKCTFNEKFQFNECGKFGYFFVWDGSDLYEKYAKVNPREARRYTAPSLLRISAFSAHYSACDVTNTRHMDGPFKLTIGDYHKDLQEYLTRKYNKKSTDSDCVFMNADKFWVMSRETGLCITPFDQGYPKYFTTINNDISKIKSKRFPHEFFKTRHMVKSKDLEKAFDYLGLPYTDENISYFLRK